MINQRLNILILYQPKFMPLKPLRKLLANPWRKPQSMLKPKSSPLASLKPNCLYAITLSEEMLQVLDAGLSRAILDRLERPDAVAPELIDDNGEDAHNFSVRERAIFRYQRAERFTLDKLLTINQLLWEGDGNYVGTLHELDLLSSWAEHELDLLSLTALPFCQFRDKSGMSIHPKLIDGWLAELIHQINEGGELVRPFRLTIEPWLSWPFRRWFSGFSKRQAES